jgi:hypothetical protein
MAARVGDLGDQVAGVVAIADGRGPSFCMRGPQPRRREFLAHRWPKRDQFGPDFDVLAVAVAIKVGSGTHVTFALSSDAR